MASATPLAPTPSPTLVAPPNPFRGLRAFQEADSHWFFGRDEQTNDLLRRLGSSRFVAVIGTSGSGKSSLVRAGLVPSLKRGYLRQGGSRWLVGTMRPFEHPTARPLSALDDCLSPSSALGPDAERLDTLDRDCLGLVSAAGRRMKSGDSLLVVVDQFEEIFRFRQTSARAEDEAAAFVKLLLSATRDQTGSIYVVLTMRSDYLGQCALFSGLPEALNRSQYLVPTLTRQQLSEVILGPARARGVSVAPALLQRALNDLHGLEDELDRLPVLQHTLTQTWNMARGRAGLTLDDYHDTRGMSAALNKHADVLYALLDARAQLLTASIFKRLTDTTATTADLRRPTTIGELCKASGASEDEVVAIIRHFSDFLVTPEREPTAAGETSGALAKAGWTDESVVDITHESLIRRWRRLRKWVTDEADAAKEYRRLVDDATHKRRTWVNPDLERALRLRTTTWNKEWAARYSSSDEFSRAIRFLRRSQAYYWSRVALIVIAVPALGVAYKWNTDREATRRAAEDAYRLKERAYQEQLNEQARTIADNRRLLGQTTDNEALLRQQADLANDRNPVLAKQLRDRAELLSEQAEALKTEVARQESARKSLEDQVAAGAKQSAQLSSVVAELNSAKDDLKRLETEKATLQQTLTTRTQERESLRQAVERLGATNSKLRTVDVQLQSIQVLRDGSSGKTGWTFQLYIDDRPLFFLAKRDYDSDLGIPVNPNKSTVVTIGAGTPKIRVDGQRTFGDDSVSGEAPLQVGGMTEVNVTVQGHEGDGHFKFRIAAR